MRFLTHENTTFQNVFFDMYSRFSICVRSEYHQPRLFYLSRPSKFVLQPISDITFASICSDSLFDFFDMYRVLIGFLPAKTQLYTGVSDFVLPAIRPFYQTAQVSNCGHHPSNRTQHILLLSHTNLYVD